MKFSLSAVFKNSNQYNIIIFFFTLVPREIQKIMSKNVSMVTPLYKRSLCLHYVQYGFSWLYLSNILPMGLIYVLHEQSLEYITNKISPSCIFYHMGVRVNIYCNGSLSSRREKVLLTWLVELMVGNKLLFCWLFYNMPNQLTL